MDAERQSMMEKILKLLELGKDGNGAFTPEQKAANDMAAKLMAKHAIDFSDLRSAKPKGNIFERQVVDPLDVVYSPWESFLAGALARTFDCQTVHYRKPQWVIHFLGTKNDLELVIFFYRHLRLTVCRKAELFSKKVREQDTYAYAMVMTIADRLDALYKKRDEYMESDCRALVVVKKDELEAFKNSLFPKLTNLKAPKLSGSMDAWRKGAEDGKHINLNRPIAHKGNNSEGMRTIRGH